MKIQVKPGKTVRLDSMTYTSVKGGTYDLSRFSEEDQKRVLNHPNVTEVKPKSATKESGSSGSGKAKSGGSD